MDGRREPGGPHPHCSRMEGSRGSPSRPPPSSRRCRRSVHQPVGRGPGAARSSAGARCAGPAAGPRSGPGLNFPLRSCPAPSMRGPARGQRRGRAGQSRPRPRCPRPAEPGRAGRAERTSGERRMKRGEKNAPPPRINPTLCNFPEGGGGGIQTGTGGRRAEPGEARGSRCPTPRARYRCSVPGTRCPVPVLGTRCPARCCPIVPACPRLSPPVLARRRCRDGRGKGRGSGNGAGTAPGRQRPF